LIDRRQLTDYITLHYIRNYL